MRRDWSAEKVNVGDKFGRLTVLFVPERLLSGCTTIKCRCDCGKKCRISLGGLLGGGNKSCGCLKKESSRAALKKVSKESRRANMKKAHEANIANSIFHGDSQNEYHKIVRYFNYMHSRCENPKDKSYEHYSQRGITVCEEWENSREGYDNFKEWFLNQLEDLGLSLEEFNQLSRQALTVDRVDNDLGYSPDNCRLATMKQQARNTSRARKFCGKHILDWADELGILHQLACDYYYKNEFGKLLNYYSGERP